MSPASNSIPSDKKALQDIRFLVVVTLFSVGVPLAMLYIMLRNTFSPRDFLHRLKETDSPQALPIALGVLTVGTLLTDISSNFLGFLHIKLLKSEILIPDGFFPLLLFLTHYLLLTPILEEFLFRGAVLHIFRRHGDLFALILSALFYAMAEESYTGFLSVFLFGLVAGYFVLHSRSVFIGILMHIFRNAIGVLLSMLTASLDADTAAVTQIALFAFILALSLLAFLRLGKKEKEVFSVDENAASADLTLSVRFKVALCNPAFILFAVIFLYRLIPLIQIYR